MGKASRDKGYRRERQVVQRFKDWGLESRRVPLSGATDYAPNDVEVWPEGREAPLSVEVKSRATLPKWIVDWVEGADLLVLIADRKDAVYILPERTLRELMTQ